MAEFSDDAGSPSLKADERVPVSWRHLICDLVILPGAFALAHYLRFVAGVFPPPTEAIPLATYLFMGALAAPVWILLHLGHGLYFQKIKAPISEEFGALVNAETQGFIFLVLASFFIRDFPSSRITLLLILLISFLGFLIIRLIFRRVRTNRLKKGVGLKPLVVIGESELGNLLIKRLVANPELGYKVGDRTAIAELPAGSAAGVIRHLLTDVPELPAVLVAGDLAAGDLAVVIGECHSAGAECILPSERSAAAGLPAKAGMIEGVPVVKLVTPGELAWLRLKKRTFDLAVIVGSSPLWAPIILLVALVSLIAEGRPVFFIHERLGRGGSTIRLFKFRTMVRDADKVSLPEGFEDKQKLDADPRVTGFGRLLRKSSIDELPQLLNILIGHMSLVGPRPIVTDELPRYGGFASLLMSVPPGLTGLWQVSGRSDLSYSERVDLDAYYIHNWSLALDLRIIFQTIPAVLKRKGAY